MSPVNSEKPRIKSPSSGGAALKGNKTTKRGNSPLNAVILACGSLVKPVSLAQDAMGTCYPVHFLNREYHVNPKEMRLQIITALNSFGANIDTVLVAMGFCGGSWMEVPTDKRVVIPRVDDCITLLLHTDNTPAANLKNGFAPIRTSTS